MTQSPCFDQQTTHLSPLMCRCNHPACKAAMCQIWARELCKLSSRFCHMSEGLSSAGMGRGIDGLMGKLVLVKIIKVDKA